MKIDVKKYPNLNLISRGEIIKWNGNGMITYWAEFEADVKKDIKNGIIKVN
ncbi:hypothetical protein [Clostridium taeniosporum]|uniref:hypothetical protein n=1 Tax=Clostridium taeniosporum TaxID=394958 RepID=UPI0013144233|nr:hypothetical protein [Clostridium taeniosporum]